MNDDAPSLTIDERCTACGLCISTCPERVLSRAPRRPAIELAACTLCGACVEICPTDSIMLGSR